MSLNLYRAALETRSFTFEAFARTKKTAEDALWQGMAVHERQTSLPQGSMRQNFSADVSVAKIGLGVLYRDSEPLPPARPRLGAPFAAARAYTNEALKPWETLGISRGTWYKRQADQRQRRARRVNARKPTRQTAEDRQEPQ